MAEMHAWARENLGNINPKLGPRLLEAAFARATWDGLVRYELGDDVWSITVHGSAENVTQRLKKAHARGAPKVEWIPQLAISRHCRIEDIRRWMEPFLSLGFYRTFDLSGERVRAANRELQGALSPCKSEMGYASRPMWASGVTPTRFGAQ
jgi:hypothetical protein